MTTTTHHHSQKQTDNKNNSAIMTTPYSILSLSCLNLLILFIGNDILIPAYHSITYSSSSAQEVAQNVPKSPYDTSDNSGGGESHEKDNEKTYEKQLCHNDYSLFNSWFVMSKPPHIIYRK
jgi:hypothetical protein